MTPDMLRKHMDRFYSPASTVACFCGKFERDKIIALCKHYFSSPANKGVIPVCPRQILPRSAYLRQKDGAESDSYRLLRALSRVGQPLRLPADSLDARRLRVVAALPPPARRTGARLFGRCLRVVISERWRVRREHGCVARIGEKAVLTAAEVLREFPDTVTEEELDLARDHYLSGLIMSLESNSARAARYGTGELLLGGAISERSSRRK